MICSLCRDVRNAQHGGVFLARSASSIEPEPKSVPVRPLALLEERQQQLGANYLAAPEEFAHFDPVTHEGI
jgi:hypothetical protein